LALTVPCRVAAVLVIEVRNPVETAMVPVVKLTTPP